MKREIIFSISYSIIVALTVGHLDAVMKSTSFTDNFPSFSSGFGSSNSYPASYINVSDVGLAIAPGASTSLSYRSYGGYLPSQVMISSILAIIPDPNMAFINALPASGSLQPNTNVTAMVTVQNTGGNSIAYVEYRICNSGIPTDSNSIWRYDASTDTVIGSITRFKINLPTSLDSFSEGSNNYIQWLVINNAGAGAQSSPFQILVSTKDTPVVVITQPDSKSEFTSLTPLIAATITDQYGGIDPTTIQIRINNASGNNILTANANSSMYNAAANTLSYQYSGPALSADSSYTLTISAVDKVSKKSGSATLQFMPKVGEIADLIPYPSPFDPKVGPINIRYVLQKRSNVWINVYDRGGRIVKNIVEAQPRGPGLCEDQWNGANFGGASLANGVYFCEVSIKNDDGNFKKYTSLAIFGK